MNELLPCLSQLDRSNALLAVFENVGAKEALEELFTDQTFEIGQQLEALLVGHVREGVIRAVTLQDRVDACIGAVKAISVHVLPEGRVSEQGFNLGKVGAMEDTRDFALRENSEALIEPEVLPVAACHIITGPRVGNLVRGDINLRLVSDDDSW